MQKITFIFFMEKLILMTTYACTFKDEPTMTSEIIKW